MDLLLLLLGFSYLLLELLPLLDLLFVKDHSSWLLVKFGSRDIVYEARFVGLLADRHSPHLELLLLLAIGIRVRVKLP